MDESQTLETIAEKTVHSRVFSYQRKKGLRFCFFALFVRGKQSRQIVHLATKQMNRAQFSKFILSLIGGENMLGEERGRG